MVWLVRPPDASRNTVKRLAARVSPVWPKPVGFAIRAAAGAIARPRLAQGWRDRFSSNDIRWIKSIGETFERVAKERELSRREH
jgi:hypothetical protein